MMMPKSLDKVLNQLEVTFSIIADLRSGEIETIGDVDAVENADLMVTLFADRESVESLNRSLEGQKLPRAWSQGKVSCIVCKPTDDAIVGLFVTEKREAVQQYHWSKKADDAIRSLFSPAEQ